MVVVTVMVMIAVRTMVLTVITCFGLVVIISYETDAKDTGDDRGNKANEGPDNSSDEPKECVRDQNRVRTCFRRRYQEGHAGRTGRTLIAHLGNYRHNRATAKRHGHTNSRTCAYGFQAIFAQPPQNSLTRNKNMNQTRKK